MNYNEEDPNQKKSVLYLDGVPYDVYTMFLCPGAEEAFNAMFGPDSQKHDSYIKKKKKTVYTKHFLTSELCGFYDIEKDKNKYKYFQITFYEKDGYVIPLIPMTKISVDKDYTTLYFDKLPLLACLQDIEKENLKILVVDFVNRGK